MSNTTQENTYRKKLVVKISAVFLGVMVLLTFFSNTINNFSLPRVKTEQPSSGPLVKGVTASGIVEAKKIVKVYSQSERKVLEVLVDSGSCVKRGDTLLVLDEDELKEKLKEEKILLEKTKLSLNKLKRSSGQGDYLTEERALKAAQDKVSEAEKELDATKSLYESGVLSRNDLDKVQKSFDDAGREYEQKQEDYDLSIKEGKRKSEELKLDIQDKQYDLELEQMKVDSISKELAAGNRITAPCDGLVDEMHCDNGSKTAANSVICEIIDTSKGFIFKAAVSNESARPLKKGDTVNVTLEGSTGKGLEGKLTDIRNNRESNGEKKDLIAAIPGEGLSGGEPGEIRISKSSKNYDILVPNSCVGRDDNGEFVYVLKEKKGPLGNEYYAQRATVAVGDHDNFKSGITSGITPEEEIIVYSSKDVLSDGCRVMPER